MTKSLDPLKQQAAYKAAERIESGMVIGLGTGSTTEFAIKRIGEFLKKGKLNNIVGISSSVRSEKLAQSLSIPLTTFDKDPQIDITIDGADEVDSDLNLIKGGGGALLREKVLAQASKINIIIVDESKLSPALGTHWALPVEVIDFARQPAQSYLESLGATVEPRTNHDGTPFRTDQNNIILDANFGPIENPGQLAERLNQRAAIVENGLFLGLATEIIVAGEKGIRHLRKD
ncbi:ribose-5-phosphate isomerase RpiA [Candidatus Saccharibacteria bacterium]|nr:ribose-5-phosphate isomerase RpiA [Candidatus Saccharibacteria bacterium]NIW79582.1 ribose-5-phosphate isomerase RpiA [Calditrichia bacterium]